MVLLFFGCNSKNNVIPRMSIPGYDTKLIFQDNFNTNLTVTQFKLDPAESFSGPRSAACSGRQTGRDGYHQA